VDEKTRGNCICREDKRKEQAEEKVSLVPPSYHRHISMPAIIWGLAGRVGQDPPTTNLGTVWVGENAFGKLLIYHGILNSRCILP